MQIQNAIKSIKNTKSFDNEIEMALLQCICTFRNVVLNDGRILAKAEDILRENQGNLSDVEDDDTVKNKSDVLNETLYPGSQRDSVEQDNYDCIAKMMGFKNLNVILSIFSEKILMNLVFGYDSQNEDTTHTIVKTTLEVLQIYCGTLSSCRLISKTEIMQKLI